jgi:hypothetical protein
MARLYLFAEGSTEQTFAADILKPHLANMGVYLGNIILIAHARKGGITHRGGGRKYIPMKNDICRILAQEKERDVFFTTMIDLYAIHTGFPGLDEAEKLRHLPGKRVEALERSFADDIGDPRFVPYIQLHEYEAYLFSDPAKFSFFYKDKRHERAILALKAIAEETTTPELINDRPHSAPSKRIIAVLPDYEGAKRVVGPQVAALIGLDVIRSKCPHFNVWLSRLEQLDRGLHV